MIPTRSRLPYLCPLVAAVLVVALPVPRGLKDLIGSDVWARLSLWFVVTLALFAILVILGLVAGRAALPFGLAVERPEMAAAATDAPLVEMLSADLGALRDADERIFERIGTFGALLEAAIERIEALESRIRQTDPGKDVADEATEPTAEDPDP